MSCNLFPLVLVLSCLVSERRNLEARLEFSEEEEELVIRMFNLVGERYVCRL